MTNSNKWAIVAVGFALCFYLGWFFPLLWLLYLITIVVVLAVPTKPTVSSAPGTSMPTYTVPAAASQPPVAVFDTSELEKALEQKAASARNDDVREGMLEALAVVQASGRIQPAVPEQPVPAVATAQPAFVAPVPVQLSPEEVMANKQKQELRNINTILYVACFLLVGAAALFIGVSTELPPVLKFMAILLVALAFYTVGLVLHTNSQRLKPAAVAFVGTGLALVPFVGLAFYSYVISDGPLVWWLTSLIGLAAFWLALLRIRAQVLSYLSLAFVFSLATSSVAVLHAPFVWYFVAIIVTASLMTYGGYKKPRWLPAELHVPLEQNAQLATPVALIGSLFAFESLKTFDYALIAGIGALHYAVNALGFATNQTRYPYWSLARALAIIFALLLTYHFTESWRWTCFTLVVSAVAVHFYALATISKQRWEEVWLWVAQFATTVALVGWADNFSQLSAGLIILALLSLHQVLELRRAEFSVLGVLAVALLPLTVLRGVIEPAIEFEYIGLIALVGAAVALLVRLALAGRTVAYQQAATLLYGVLAIETVLVGALSFDALWFGSLVTGVGALLFLAAFVERQAWVHAISNLALAIGIYVLYGETLGSYTWALLATGWTLGIIWYSLRWYFASATYGKLDHARAEIMMVSTLIILLVAALFAVIGISEELVPAGALTGIVAAAIIAYEGNVRRQTSLYELAIYIATFSLQRLVAHNYPGADLLVYTHWWALTGGVVAALRLNLGDREGAKARGILALAAMSIPTGLFALGDPDQYQLLFLLEHVALLIAGAATNKKLLVQWGGVGIGLALLWLLSGYTYVLLTLIALGLMGLAIWRLMKK